MSASNTGATMYTETQKEQLRQVMRYIRAKGEAQTVGDRALLITLERQHGYDLDALASTYPGAETEEV